MSAAIPFRHRYLLSLIFSLVFLPNTGFTADPEGIAFFEKRVRPVLVENCYACHGERQQSAGLRLDGYNTMLKGGDTGHAVVPGDAEKSLLVQAIRYEHEVFKMPPTGKLPDEDIENLTIWVKMGAPHPNAGQDDVEVNSEAFDLEIRLRHWSFQPLQDAVIPQVKMKDRVRSPVDAFILQKLEENGMSPAKEADRRTLIRRLSYDLIGLPPTPQEVHDYITDDSADAYKNLVERLLASPHYGERWGRHWLDLVRYAETDGHEFDHDKPNIWRYRDYVIRAMNEDVPYDRFLLEHIAGDQLEDPRVHPDTGLAESPIGTGFMWLCDVVNSPVDSFKAHADRLENQVDVFGKAFLGLTLACARCHDHKFDPVTQEDFYALAGIFQSSRPMQKALTPPPTQQKYRRISENTKRVDRSIAEIVMKPMITQTAEYLSAARDLLEAFHQRDAEPRDILFEDFESGTYNKWSVEGEAFRSAPPIAVSVYRDYTLDRWRGSFVADSFHNSSNEYTGKLTSKPFLIERNYVSFLVAGGIHKNKTCVNLVIDGDTVHTATGRNSGSLREVTWDVREHWGKEASFEVVDDHSGEWGHLIVDHVVFSNGGEPPYRMVAQLAEERAMDAAWLQHWLSMIRRADDPVSPLFPVHRYLHADLNDKSFAAWKQDTLKRIQNRFIPTERNPDYEVYEDFPEGMKNDWIITGEAFRHALSQQPQSIFHRYLSRFLGKDDYRYIERGGRGFVHSGLVSDPYEGVMVSPVFISDKRYVHVRMMGTGNVNVVSDEFRARNARARSEHEFLWSTHDIQMYEKKRNYVEIIDHDPEGFIVVDQIVFSDKREPPSGYHRTEEPQPDPSILQLLRDAEIESFEHLAQEYEALFLAELKQWVYDQAAGEPAVSLMDWCLREGSPFSAWEHARNIVKRRQDDRLQTLVRYREDALSQIEAFRFALTMTDDAVGDMPLHIRGNHKNHGDRVPRGFLTGFSDRSRFDPKQSSGRLQLARELIEKAKHLVSRVMVNRIWKHHFGEGIVRTPDDFGLQGQPPTHPELLDWLAAEFIRSGWSIKHIHRIMLLSGTYRMSSEADPEYTEIDPLNQRLHHIPVRRLEAESIRDAVLAVSGSLDPTLYGPSVMPYISAFMDGRGRPAKSGPMDGEGRRSIYINIRRNFMVPMFLAFDYPPPISAIGKRGVSSVPAQALIMLNNDFIYQQTERWAQRILALDVSPQERVIHMYESALARIPTEIELQAILEFIQTQKKQYDERAEFYAWRDLCHVIFNAAEFIFMR